MRSHRGSARSNFVSASNRAFAPEYPIASNDPIRSPTLAHTASDHHGASIRNSRKPTERPPVIPTQRRLIFTLSRPPAGFILIYEVPLEALYSNSTGIAIVRQRV